MEELPMNRPLLKIALLAAGIGASALPVLADGLSLSAGQPKGEQGKGVLKGVGSPDLVVLPRYAGNTFLPNTGFCGPWNGGNQSVRFYVRNVGSEAAPASVAYVGFGGSLTATVNVPALAPGQQSSRSVAVPIAAWGSSQLHGSVNFLIAADHNDNVPESNVSNNYAQSSCIGPAG